MESASTLPVSVIIPTVGRVRLLEACLRSLAQCVPKPDDVVVVDQSQGDDVAAMVTGLDARGFRTVACDGVGIAAAMNTGLSAAAYDLVLVTHDDCTVAPDWVALAVRHIETSPLGIVTGRVLAPRGSGYVPSTKEDLEPQDFTGRLMSGVLYPANMVGNRRELRAIGGFDERPCLRYAAEDNDLCYRWLVSGRKLRYEPDLVVWHHDWRSPKEVLETHKVYARSQGGFYAKHLHGGDRRVLRMLWWDLRHGVSAVVRGVVDREPRWQDPYREMVLSLLFGLVVGWREARSLERT